MLFLYRITAEAVSDDAAVLGYSKDIVKTYAMLLVTTTPVREKLPVVWKNNFSSEGKMIKRRINYMMKKRKNGWMRKGIIAMVSALTIAASAGTVLAYEPLQSSDVTLSEVVTDDVPEFLEYEFADESTTGEKLPVDSVEEETLADLDFSGSDEIFTYLDGTVVEVKNENTNKALCKHNMKDGTLKSHKSDGKGGCTVKVYSCQRCTRCGYMANAVYKYTITYAKCPH